jgi:hypothetical protein
MSGKSSKAQRRIRARQERFDLDTFEPIELSSQHDDDEPEIEEIEVFRIDGKSFFMPDRVPFRCQLEMLDATARGGEAAGVRYAMITTLGEEGYAALMSLETLDREKFEQILQLATQIIASSAGKA